jgi:hypothetical protein
MLVTAMVYLSILITTLLILFTMCMASRPVADSPGSGRRVLVVAAQVWRVSFSRCAGRGRPGPTGQREAVGAVFIDASFSDAAARRRPPGPFAYQGGLAHDD